MDFWRQPKRGLFLSWRMPDYALLARKKAEGFDFIVLSPDRWSSQKPQFLLGSSELYRGLNPDDLARLAMVLDWCEEVDLKVIFAPTDLPGRRYPQNAKEKDDNRLWIQQQYAVQAGRYWRDILGQIGEHPALAAISLVYRPDLRILHPEHRGSHADDIRRLAHFYRAMLKNIRRIAPGLPVILETDEGASPSGLLALATSMEGDDLWYGVTENTYHRHPLPESDAGRLPPWRIFLYRLAGSDSSSPSASVSWHEVFASESER
jgi:hypothetical protein